MQRGSVATCRECGHEVAPGAAFCEVCGVPAVVACPTCGAQQPAAARFCSKCGATIPAPNGAVAQGVASSSAPYSGVPPTAPAVTSKPPLVLWIIAVVAVAAVVAAIGIYLVKRDPGAATPDAQPADSGQLVSDGEGWVTQWSATDYDLNDVSFADAQTGWAVGGMSGSGDVGIILKTEDGGATWTIQDAWGGFGSLLAVYAVSTERCCAVGADGTILTTRDGGATWSAQQSGASYLSALTFDGLRGWCVGYSEDNGGDVVLRTEDGGYSWVVLGDGVSLGTCLGLDFVDADRGWAACAWPEDSGAIQRSADGGASWQSVRDVFGHYKDVCFVDAEHGWALGGEWSDGRTIPFIERTSDGGKTWTRYLCRDAVFLDSVFFADGLNGWAVGDGVWRTADGGETWTQQLALTNTDVSLTSCYFVNGLTGIVVGAAGTILNTGDGGAGDGTTQSMDEAAAVSPADTEDEMQAYLRRLQELIREARRGREKLRHAVYGFGGGSVSGHDAAAEMEEVIANRESVLNQVRGIAVPDAAAARRCRTTLMAAMQASIDADEHYLAWMEGHGSSASATPHDKAAGRSKARFVRQYNALAAEYGMRSDWEVEDL